MSNWTQGTDLSHWAGDIDFGKMYTAGARWTVIKTSDANRDTGFLFEDAKFEQNAKQIFERGQLLAGGYHWLQASVDPIKAADFYLERYRKFSFHFPPVMDFEEKSVFGKGLANHYIWCAQTWLEYVHRQTGRLPIIYTANWYTSQFDQSKMAWMNKYPLWVASYPWIWTILSKPLMPGKIWDDWTFWQYSADNNNRGKEFGQVGGSIDLNWFKGSYEDLLKWLGTSEPLPEPPDVGLINVPVFSQKDARWANDKLGTSAVTIGGYGCLVTATAMVCKYFGKDTDPGKLNKALIAVNGYESGNLMRWNSITDIYPDVATDWTKFITSPSNADIDKCLEAKLPVIVQVDFIPATPILDQHWVVIVGKDAGDYRIIDPIDGTTTYLSRYPGKVYKMAVFIKQSEPEPPGGDTVYVIEMLGHLRIRQTPNGDVFSPEQYALKGETHHSDKEQNGWYRITRAGITGWIAGGQWTRITQVTQPPEPDPPPDPDPVHDLAWLVRIHTTDADEHPLVGGGS
jgi:GH25 family lysozyme M1 (1,4-beta-N-acetylmuramidase)